MCGSADVLAGPIAETIPIILSEPVIVATLIVNIVLTTLETIAATSALRRCLDADFDANARLRELPVPPVSPVPTLTRNCVKLAALDELARQVDAIALRVVPMNLASCCRLLRAGQRGPVDLAIEGRFGRSGCSPVECSVWDAQTSVGRLWAEHVANVVKGGQPTAIGTAKQWGHLCVPSGRSPAELLEKGHVVIRCWSAS